MLADMGNREALLDGAKRCLLEKGYAKTTARDVADAAGVSLAAIGYHYGSKESLLEQAFMSAMEDWFDDDDSEAVSQLPNGSLGQFRQFFAEIQATFPEQKPLMRLNLEMGLEGMHNPSLGGFMARAMDFGRSEFAKAFAGLDVETDGKIAWQVGSFYSLLMTGMVAQYLIDPEHLPDATDLAEGLRFIAERLRAA